MGYDREQINKVMHDLAMKDQYIEIDELAEDAFSVINETTDVVEVPQIFYDIAEEWVDMLIDSNYN